LIRARIAGFAHVEKFDQGGRSPASVYTALKPIELHLVATVLYQLVNNQRREFWLDQSITG
jgi:hypothetical protein